MNFHDFNPETSCQSFQENQQTVIPFQNNNYNDHFVSNNNNNNNVVSTQVQPYNIGSNILQYDLHHPLDPTQVPEIPDTCFNYISELLRDEYSSSNDHFDTSNSTLNDYMAAQMSYNKSLDAALHRGENTSFSSSSDVVHQQWPPPDICQSSRYCLDDYLNMFSSANNVAANTSQLPCYVPNVIAADHNIMHNGFVDVNVTLFESSCLDVGPTPATLNANPFEYMVNDTVYVQGSNGMNNLYSETTLLQDYSMMGSNSEAPKNGNDGGSLNESSRRRKNDEDNEENQEDAVRKNKHSAPTNDVIEQIEEYDDVILCPEGRSKPGVLCNNSGKTLDSGDCSKGSKKKGSKGQLVDLRGLLTRCAQCVAQVDLSSAYEVLKQIRGNSSPYGDFLQRVAHYLANGLEARLEGKGIELSRVNEEVSPCEVLKANRIYVASVPFQIMSFYTMNKTIARLVEEAPSIHIIDFGIYYGLQWPCIIQNLSKRPNGPPKIRITGVDFPQRGFRPSERVEETGRCLAKYCQKYNVPFEYYPISKKWEDVEVDELKIEGNEPLVVNCLYRAHLLFDESVEENSPRDAFLKLVRKIKPDIFMHAVVNSTSSVPFFLNRFKEAMFHYSALFDIFESTMNREDNERMLLESMVYGSQALNVIACEGLERVERPEGYKQWQVRTQRAGFEQVGLDRELLKRARAMVRRSFRPEFSYDQDGRWVVQGWKGRILYAISCWKPA